MDKILRIASPQAVGVSDGLYSFVVRLSEAPAEHWIYSFKLATPVAREFDPERVVFDRQGGLLFDSEEALVLGWIGRAASRIAAANRPLAHRAEPSSLSDKAESYSGDGGNWTTQANVSQHGGEIVRPGPHAAWQRPGSRAHHPVSGDWSDPRRHRQQTCNTGRIRRETPR